MAQPLITTAQRVVIGPSKLDVTFDPDFLTPEYAAEAYAYLLKHAKWPKFLETLGDKRMNCNYGDRGVKYEFSIRGSMVRREVYPWSDLPFLEKLRDHISAKTGISFNYVVLQLYPNHRVGMNPHRDKEMVPGTTIAGLSLGAVRTLTIANPKTWRSARFRLDPGSLYLLNPPTNDHNTHAIELGDPADPAETGVRISLTFRLMPVDAAPSAAPAGKTPAPVRRTSPWTR